VNKKPKILMTNDDGIEAKGLWHLWHALAPYADITIVAPTTQKSGVGLGLTLHKPITLNPAPWDPQTSAWKVSGTPADCVRFGLKILLNEAPDLIVSGINHGSNSGRNVLYSGTIGGVIEGALRGLPGIAFSGEDEGPISFEHMEAYIWPLVSHILEHPLSSGTLLNVNFPWGHAKFRGVKLAKQGQGLWREALDKRLHPNGEPYFWHGGEWWHHEEEEDSDVALLKEGYITVVPIQVNQLTDRPFFDARKDLFDRHFEQ
jgi:5'-nucleotidase